MIRLATGRGALFGALLVLALILFLPLRLVLGAAGLGDSGLTARTVDGSLWSGTLGEASAAGLRLGDLRAGLSPGPLLLGGARLNLASRSDATPPFHGSIMVSRHALGADGVTATLASGNLFAPLPVTVLDLDDVSVGFRDGLCERAEGRVRATLAGEVAGVPLAGALGGDARCEAGALLLPLASQAGTEQVQLRIRDGGHYAARLLMVPPDAATAARLTVLGFQPAGRGYQLSVEGAF